MKNKFMLIFTILLFLALDNPANAQIVETQNMSSQGTHNSFVLSLPTMDNDLAEEVWKKLVKEYKGKTRYNKKIGEYFTDDGVVKGMSNNTVDIYSRIQGGKIILWFDLGGAYLNTIEHPERIFAAEDVFSQYEYALNVKLAEAEIDTKEKELKSLEAALDRFEKEKLNIQKLKDKALSEVAEQDRNLENNAANQKMQFEKIHAQEDSIDDSKTHKNSLAKRKLKVNKSNESN